MFIWLITGETSRRLFTSLLHTREKENARLTFIDVWLSCHPPYLSLPSACKDTFTVEMNTLVTVESLHQQCDQRYTDDILTDEWEDWWELDRLLTVSIVHALHHVNCARQFELRYKSYGQIMNAFIIGRIHLSDHRNEGTSKTGI